jgi:hypothetical protein
MQSSLISALFLSGVALAQQPAQQNASPNNSRQQPGASITLYAPEQHDLYDGHFVISANRIHMVGSLNDPQGWDHMDNAAANVKPVNGTVELDLNEVQNTGKFEARLQIPEGDLVLALDRFHEFAPCQNGGIVAYLHEHGTDSGCDDNNWPKTFVFLAGWGYGHATLNGRPLYQDYEMHFMVTQEIRDRRTLKANYPCRTRDRLPEKSTQPHSRLIFTSGVLNRIPIIVRNAKFLCTSSAWKSRGNDPIEEQVSVPEHAARFCIPSAATFISRPPGKLTC